MERWGNDVIFLKFDENGNEFYRHYKPHLLSKEELSTGLLVQSIPKPTSNQSNVLKYDGKKLYYEDLSVQQIKELQDENVLLKAQTTAVAERTEFVEDVVAEMAIQVYR